MSGYKNFAVLGSGSVGKHILDALSEKKKAGVVDSVSVLTRSAEGHEDLAAKGINVIKVDYSSPSSVKAALSGVDVIISALGLFGLPFQEGIAEIAKDAGVKLFVPSEWAVALEGAETEMHVLKRRIKENLKVIGLPYATFYTGGWTDWYFGPEGCNIFGIDIASWKGDIRGSGNEEISFVSRRDVGRYVVHVLTSLPRSKLEWRSFRIVAEIMSMNRIVADWEAYSGKKLSLTYHSRSEYEEALAKNPDDLIASLILFFLDGKASEDQPELTNYEWPEWNPQKVMETLIEMHGRK